MRFSCVGRTVAFWLKLAVLLLGWCSPTVAKYQYDLGNRTRFVLQGRECNVQTITLLTMLRKRTGWNVLCDINKLYRYGSVKINGKTLYSKVECFAVMLQRLHRDIRISNRASTGTLYHMAGPQVKPVPRWRVRGHQVASSHHPAMFRSWDQLKTFVADLSVFGTNQIELAHVSPEPKTGKLPVQDLVGISNLVQQVGGVNFSVWWSTDLIKGNMDDLSALFLAMPKLDSLFFPGGDGGSLEWPVIAEASKLLRDCKTHSSAGVWVSAQEVNASTLSALAELLRSDMNRTTRVDILGKHGGVVFGPHNRIPLTDFVELFQSETGKGDNKIKVRQYPDICHSVDAGFAIPGWDRAWAMAYKRQVVNPMPMFFSQVVKERSNGTTPTVGVGAYSEGLNDDLNKVVWSAMGEDKSVSVDDVVHQYARYFFGADAEENMVNALFGLEQNWANGQAHLNGAQIEKTLEHLESAAEKVFGSIGPSYNWRMAMYLRRGLMDIYVQTAIAFDWSAKAKAVKMLQGVTERDCVSVVQETMALLAKPQDDPRRAKWREQIDELTKALNATVGNEVLQTQDIYLNLQTLDAPERLEIDFLFSVLENITKAARGNNSSKCRMDVERDVLFWTDPGKGGFYDDLGSIVSADHPHLLDASAHPERAANGGDPSCYFHPLQGGIDVFPNVRPSWLRYSMSFYDAPLVLQYEGLSTASNYRLRIVYWYCFYDCEYDAVRLTANDGAFTVHDYMSAPNPMQALEFNIPQNQTNNGQLRLECTRRKGLGGNGKTCQMSEAWLFENENFGRG